MKSNMLIIHRLGPEPHRYYLRAIGPDSGDAPERGEAPGRWLGAGAADRGLDGVVVGPALRDVLPSGRGRVPGLDMTFAAPKSVSVLHGLGSPEVAAAVRHAHDAAVDAGIAYLERHACAVRVDGRSVEATGLVIAAFRHRTSRADDPHLHTHAVTANLACGPDGVWRALHTPLLYGQRRGAAAMYHVVLRDGLTRSLGVTWEAAVGGRADCREVPSEMRGAFSQRRAAVLDGADGYVGDRKWAERVTRPERVGLIDAVGLHAVWRTRAREAGWEVPTLGAGQRAAVEVHLEGLVPTVDRWTRADAMVAIANALIDGASAQEAEAICDGLINRPEVVRLGRSTGRHAASRFTTATALARQDRVASMLASVPTVDDRPEALDQMRRRLADSGHRLVVVVADESRAAALSDRTGALTLPVEAAATTLIRLGLGAGDAMVVDGAHRMASASVQPLLEAARACGIQVMSTHHPSTPLVTEPVGSLTTIDDEHGSLTAAASAGRASATAIDDWAAAGSAGRQAVLVAEPNEIVDLNVMARAALREAGRLASEEVGGMAVGDRVRFTAPRPTLGVDRHDSGRVTSTQVGAARITVTLNDGRQVDLRAGQLAGVVHAHVVPPLASLIAGRGDVYVLGGRDVAERHLSGHDVHRYITVDVGRPPPGLSPAERRSPLPFLDHEADLLRRRLLPDERGEQRRLDGRARAAASWSAQATHHHEQAVARGDPAAAVMWMAQRTAAYREVDAVEEAARQRDRRGPARAALEEASAPDRDRLAALRSHIELRVAALGRLAEGVGADLGAPPHDAMARREWRAAGARSMADAERFPDRSIDQGLGIPL